MSFPAWVLVGFLTLSVWAVALYLLREETPQRLVPFLRSFEATGPGQRRERWARSLRHPLSVLFLILLLATLGWALLRHGLETAEPRLLSLVVDVSRKMELPAVGTSGPTRFDLAKERAVALLKTLSVGQEAMLIEAGGRARLRVAPTTHIEQVLEELKALNLLDTEAALAPALQLSEAVADGRQLEVVVLTHGQVSVVPRPSTALTIVGLGDAGEPANLAVRSFSARRYPLGAGRFEAVAMVESNAPEPTFVRATLSAVDLVSGKRSPLDVSEFELASGASRRLVFREETGMPSALECKVERVDGKPELGLRDNVGRALLPEERPLRILVVGQESLFLTAAFLSSGKVRLTHIAPGQYPPRGQQGNLLDFDLTVFRDLPLAREASTGPAVYFAQAGRGLPVAAGKALKMFGFDESDRKSRLFRFFDPFDTQILKGSALVPEDADRVLASSGGLPLVVTGERKEGRFVAVGFEPENSDMVLRSAFPLFIRGLMEELLGEVSHELIEPTLAGDTLTVSLPELNTLRGQALSSSADDQARTGAASPMASEARKPASVELRGPLFELGTSQQTLELVDSTAEFEPTRAGFYELRTRDGGSRYLAVNSRPLALGTPSPSSSPGAAPAPHPAAPRPAWIGWVIAVLGLGILEYYSYHRRWTV